MIDAKLGYVWQVCPSCEGRPRPPRRVCAVCRGEGRLPLPVDPNSQAFLAGSETLQQWLVRVLEVANLWKRQELLCRRLGEAAEAAEVAQRRAGLLIAAQAIEAILERALPAPRVRERPRLRSR